MNQYFCFFAFLVFAQVCNVHAAKVLFLPYGYPGHSHLKQTHPIAEELLNNPENDVTFAIDSLIYESTKYVHHPSIHYEVYPSKLNASTIDNVYFEVGKMQFRYSRFLGMKKIADLQEAQCEAMLYNRNLIDRLQRKNFDVIVFDPTFSCNLVMIEHLNSTKKLVVFYAIGASLPALTEMTGMPESIVHTPTFMSNRACSMNTMGRIGNAILYFAVKMFATFTKQNLYSKYAVAPTIGDRINAYLVPTVPGIECPRPIPPNLHYIGPMMLDNKYEPISTEMTDFIYNENSSSPLIIVSFGTAITPDKGFYSSLLPVFASLPQYKFIFKVPRENPDKVTIKSAIGIKNVKIVHWIPEFQELMMLNRTNLFINHCGTNSFHEAIYYGLPQICIPFWADHFEFSGRLEHLNVGKFVLLNSISTQLQPAIVDMVEKTEYYKVNTMKYAKLLHKVNGTVAGAKIVQDVIDNDLSHLTIHSLFDLSWYQYMMLDIILFYSIILYFLGKGMFRLGKSVARIIFTVARIINNFIIISEKTEKLKSY